MSSNASSREELQEGDSVLLHMPQPKKGFTSEQQRRSASNPDNGETEDQDESGPLGKTCNLICNLIAKHKSSEVTFPVTNEEQLAIKAGFYTKFGLKGVVGAIDCTHVALICPPKNDPTKPCSLYMNRKGYYSVNVEAVCDDKLRFLAINANFPGSCHDSGLWTTSKVRSFMSTSRGSLLLGDQGYPLEPWLITPLAESASLQEEKFNKMHCKARNVVERGFGVVKSRFRCISQHRTLHYSPEVVTIIVNTCFILHNIMVKLWPNDEVELEEEESWELITESSNATSSHLHREGERVRRHLINHIA
ncbi:PREDICTED: putative nuclease HARBI1 [Rhagoletis zephyria]|uniref:putative nuclease HARBI1 n=1 Tax=Rhagoletis zephyria TaxID=28612 RepID=UPI000811836E|nr:PREDICTED: putative nuclease HARBI1 [Rhagoletis zephyria]